MSNERKNIQKKGAKPLVRAKGEESRAKGKKQHTSYDSQLTTNMWLNAAIVCGILLVTFICYRYTLDNRFTNWDDSIYTYENPYIKNLTPANMRMILFHNITNNYYHPITMLSIAMNFHFSGMNPEPYYLTQVLIHLLNTALVFFLSAAMLNAMVRKGYGKIKGIPFWAGLCSLWHGIHPMHVESVAWIAERKDVLYLFFYLLGMLIYVRYVMDGKRMYFILTVLLFIFSLFSKPLAVVFPLSLLAIDILLKRDEKFAGKQGAKMANLLSTLWKLLINKIPFFLISLFFGVIAYQMQVASGTIVINTFVQRVTIVCVNYLMYPFKFFVPLPQSAIYLYPELSAGTYLPVFFYAAPFLAVGITALLLWISYKAGENYFRITLFGIAYYFFNVMFILQFVSSGPAIMADRYSYAPYFGLVFVVVYFIYALIEKLPSIKYPAYIVLTAFSVMLAWLCEARTHAWHNTQTLFKDEIAKYPANIDTVYNANHTHYELNVKVRPGIETAYKNLANYYVEKDTVRQADYDSAYRNFQILESINSTDATVYSSIGNIWAIKGDFSKSLAAYTRALKIDSTSKKCFDIYLDRGITFSKMGQNDLALKDLNRADKLEPYNQQLYETRGLVYLYGTKQMDSAIADFNRIIAIEPSKANYYTDRGQAELNKSDFRDAVSDFNRNLSMGGKDPNTIFDLSLCYKDMKDYRQALSYGNKAKAMGYKLPEGYLEELQSLAR